MIHTIGYLSVRVENKFGNLSLVDDRGHNILHNFPINTQMQVQFVWDGPVKKSASFTIDSDGKIDAQAGILMFKPGAKVTVEWEE